MGRKKKAEVIERVEDAGENLQAEAIDYATLCREYIFDYFRKHHEGEKNVVVNGASVAKEPWSVFLSALRNCRYAIGTFPGLKLPYNKTGYTNYRYDQKRAFTLAEIFIDLCQSTNHSPSVRGFCDFSGIDINTLKLWKQAGVDAGAFIWDMLIEGGRATKKGKLDDSNNPVGHIADLNMDAADGLYARNTDNAAKTIDQIVAEMGIIVDSNQIEDKGGNT